MLYRRANNGKVINANNYAEVVKYIQGLLTEGFDLDKMPKDKPGLTHHWSRDRSVFPTEDDRLDLATIMLFQSYTAGRPAEFVNGTKSRGRKDPLLDELEDHLITDATNPEDALDSPEDTETDTEESEEHSVFDDEEYNTDATEDTDLDDNELDESRSSYEAEKESRSLEETDEFGDAIRKHKALCYEDITLWIAQDPKRGGRDVLAMEVYLRHHKGADRKPKPTIFLFREYPLTILCPISYILARAIRDDAIDIAGYTSAEPFFSTNLSKNAVKVAWKPSWLKRPVFRKSVRTTFGGWEKSQTEPMKYATYAFYLDRIGRDLGYEDKWTSYYMRRSTINAIIEKAPNAVENAYLNHRVGYNVQDAFLERDPSADGLTRAFTHMSIRCNPEVPKEIPKEEFDKLPQDPSIVELRRAVTRQWISIRQQYQFIKTAPEDVVKEYRQVQRNMKNAEKSFRDEMTKIFREAYRHRVHKEELERQLNGIVLEERNQLQVILYDFNTDLELHQNTKRKIRAINLMVSLVCRREIRQPRLLAPCEDSTPEDLREETHGEKIPLMIDRRQCIYCVGDTALPLAARLRKFSKPSNMMTHVENVHLKQGPTVGRFLCHHPDCKHLGDFLKDLDHFKAHVQTVHGPRLRK
ncbi:FluG domain containing protein [Rhypophila sp. PSN 637]